MTKRELFETIQFFFTENSTVELIHPETEQTITSKDIVNFATHEIELLKHKKAQSSKPSKNQKENEKVKNLILEVLKENDFPMRITDLQKDPKLNQFTNQKISALITQLKKSEDVIRTEVKRQAYFTINVLPDVE